MQNTRIIQKKQDIHKTQNIADTDKIWTEVQQTLQWVLSQILNFRGRIKLHLQQQQQYYL